MKKELLALLLLVVIGYATVTGVTVTGLQVSYPVSGTVNYNVTVSSDATENVSCFTNITDSNSNTINTISNYTIETTPGPTVSQQTYSISGSQKAGIYTVTAVCQIQNGQETFNVSQNHQAPAQATNTTSVVQDKGTTAYVNISVTNNANFDQTIDLSNDCSLYTANFTCALGASSLATAAGATNSTTLTITIPTSATAGSTTLNLNATSNVNSTSKDTDTITITINPNNTFDLANYSNLKTATPDAPASYNITINNTGEVQQAFTLSTVPDSGNFQCAVDASKTINAGAKDNVTLTVTPYQNTTLNEEGDCIVIVMNPYSKQRNITLRIKVTNWYNITITAVNAISSTYFGKANDSASYNFTVKNTGNSQDTILIKVTAGSWNTTVNNGTATLINSNSTNYTKTLVAGATETIQMTTDIPLGSTTAESSAITVYAESTNNPSKNTTTAATVKVAQLAFTPVFVFDKTTEKLNVTMSSVTKSGVVLTSAQVSSITYDMTYSNGTIAQSSTLTFNTTKQIDMSVDATWPSGNYTFNITVIDTNNDNKTQLSGIRVARSVSGGITATAIGGAVPGGNYTPVVITSKYDYGEFFTPTLTSPLGACSLSLFDGSTHTFTCSVGSVSSGDYNVTLSSVKSDCARFNATCTFTPTLNVTDYATVSVQATTTSTTQQTTQQQAATNTTTAAATTTTTTAGDSTETTEETIVSSKDINVSEFVTEFFTEENTVFIFTVENNADATLNVSLSAEENSDYLNLDFSWDSNNSLEANSSQELQLVVKPRQYAKPGTYNATVNINGIEKNITYTVMKPADGNQVHRYVELPKNLSEPVVYLRIENNGTVTQNITITENISKDYANHTDFIEFMSDHPYTIIQEDPVIQWNVLLDVGNATEIAYRIKNLTLQNDTLEFIDPELLSVDIDTTVPASFLDEFLAHWQWYILFFGVFILLAAWIIQGQGAYDFKPATRSFTRKFSNAVDGMWDKLRPKPRITRAHDMANKPVVLARFKPVDSKPALGHGKIAMIERKPEKQVEHRPKLPQHHVPNSSTPTLDSLIKRAKKN